ncbi:MAG TPA: HAD family hydrolase [Dongiaceae bacterium]|nr:HAD family hydrolase [Dongiaceae bacterium]
MKIAFLDRDGVINRNVGYLYQISEFVFESGAVEGLRRLVALGYSIVIITNQSGMARGYYTQLDYERLTHWMQGELTQLGIPVLDILYCPHHPSGVVAEYAIECDCRKPKPGMIEQTLERFAVARNECILVGDNLTDIEAGRAAGISQLFWVVPDGDVRLAEQLGCKRMDNLNEVSLYLADLKADTE